MWQTDWADRSRQRADMATPQLSALRPAAVSSTYLLFWMEHCIECAVPDCYKVCPLYVARLDRKCARLKNGILPNPQYPGLFPFGAEVEFRRWGKLESNFGLGSLKPRHARVTYRIDRLFLQCIRPVSSLLRGISPYRRLNGAYALFRERVLQTLTQDPGRTIRHIPVASMNIDLYGTSGMIRVYPDNDAEAHLVFAWLDFVKYQQLPDQSAGYRPAGAREARLANKVKCVIWDLDQTTWDGILGEQDSDRVSLRPEVQRTMHALDERGVLQSIASKNDRDHAWQVLQRLGVAHLFLYPQISWEPKSVAIRRIAESLNIGVDGCLFIDDSPFERAEVIHELPGIRVLADSEVGGLLVRPEFDVPVTNESKQRRAFYVAESQRKQHSLAYGDRYETFLKTCHMQATLFRPTEPEHVERCLELLHRSNQLNLSTHRYTREEFAQLLQPTGVLCIATSCRDRFGDYGIVGLASLIMSKDRVILKDFVLSCRVAQKRVENAWFKWLTGVALAAGYKCICAPYVRTSRNVVLHNALIQSGFVETRKDDTGSMLELNCDVIPPGSEIVSIVACGLELVPVTLTLGSPQLGSDIAAPREAAS